VGLIEAGGSLTLDPTIIASQTSSDSLPQFEDLHPSDSVYYSAFSQSFTSPSYECVLSSVVFSLYKYGTPVGNGYAKLYTHGGVYGTSSVPNGAALATSDPVDVSTLAATPTDKTISFTDNYILQPNTHYVITWENPTAGTINDGNEVRSRRETSNVTGGNYAIYVNGAWVTYATYDAYFKIYAYTPPAIGDYSGDPSFLQATDGWVNITVLDLDLVADLYNVTLEATQDGNQTFSITWTQATNTFSEVDPDGICTIGAASVRTNINTTAEQICFQFQLGPGTSVGVWAVNFTAYDDHDLLDYVEYPAAFFFTSYNWIEEVYDWINGAFAQFGIIDYMTSITTLITTFAAEFADSMVNLGLLVYQQFRIIGAVFGFFIFWYAAMTDIILDLSLFYQSILNNTATWSNGIGNLWDFLSYSSWAPILPLVFLIWWMDSVENRGKQTVGGWTQVVLNDVNTVISVSSYFVGMFSLIINTIIDRVYGLFDAKP